MEWVALQRWRLLPPQVAEMSCYSADGEITSVCADFLVVQAVFENRSPALVTRRKTGRLAT
jgi:hypothetical protein